MESFLKRVNYYHGPRAYKALKKYYKNSDNFRSRMNFDSEKVKKYMRALNSIHNQINFKPKQDHGGSESAAHNDLHTLDEYNNAINQLRLSNAPLSSYIKTMKKFENNFSCNCPKVRDSNGKMYKKCSC